MYDPFSTPVLMCDLKHRCLYTASQVCRIGWAYYAHMLFHLIRVSTTSRFPLYLSFSHFVDEHKSINRHCHHNVRQHCLLKAGLSSLWILRQQLLGVQSGGEATWAFCFVARRLALTGFYNNTAHRICRVVRSRMCMLISVSAYVLAFV